MRKHSGLFKVFTVAIVFVVAFVTTGISSMAVSAFVTTTQECGKTLCSKKMIVAGPYKDLDTIDDSVPYVGGRMPKDILIKNIYGTLSDVYDGDWTPCIDCLHVFFCYCPNYSSGDLIPHSFIAYFMNHVYEISEYRQYNANQHIVSKKCIGSGTDYFSVKTVSEGKDLSSSEVSAIQTTYCKGGCGHTAFSYEYHTWTYGNWTSVDASTHTRTKTCSLCGYSTTETASHSLTNGSWSSYNDTQHKRNVSCSACGYSYTDYQSHIDSNDDHICDSCNYLMTYFSVSVPTNMNIAVDKNGIARTATNAKIYNNSSGSVTVKSISLTGKNGWTIVPFSTNMANQKVNSKLIGFKVGNSVSTTSSSMTMSGDWTIAKGSSLSMPYNAVVSATTTPVTDQNVMDITFVIDWSDA